MTTYRNGNRLESPTLGKRRVCLPEDCAHAAQALPRVAVFSSPLRRAVASAKPLCEAGGIRQWEGKEVSILPGAVRGFLMGIAVGRFRFRQSLRHSLRSLGARFAQDSNKNRTNATDGAACLRYSSPGGCMYRVRSRRERRPHTMHRLTESNINADPRRRCLSA